MADDRAHVPVDPPSDRPGPAGGGAVPSRRRYARPMIVRYGDVTQLTRSGVTGSKNDKGSGSKTRTN